MPGDTTTRTVGQAAWLLPRPARPTTRLRLLCLLGCAGPPSLVDPWAAVLPPAVEVCVVQLPGTGARSGERLPTRLDPVVAGVADVLLWQAPVATVLFGHSTGALLAFELARTLTVTGRPPMHLIVAGCRAPQDPRPADPTDPADLGDPTDPADPADPALRALRLAARRADAEICRTYRYLEGPPLPMPITAFGCGELDAWFVHTRLVFHRRRVAGGPGAVFAAPEVVGMLLATTTRLLDSYLPACSAPHVARPATPSTVRPREDW